MLNIDFVGYLTADLRRSLRLSELQMSFIGELKPLAATFLIEFACSEFVSTSMGLVADSLSYWVSLYLSVGVQGRLTD